jgi:hypothetical protein
MRLDSFPLWEIFLVTMGLITLFVEAGFRLGRRRRLPASEKSESSATMVGAMMALLGFLLVFTFGAASSRYDIRKDLVIQEVNAIGTTYLRAGILPEPYGTQIRGLLRDYVDSRVKLVEMATPCRTRSGLWPRRSGRKIRDRSQPESLFNRSMI